MASKMLGLNQFKFPKYCIRNNESLILKRYEMTEKKKEKEEKERKIERERKRGTGREKKNKK